MAKENQITPDNHSISPEFNALYLDIKQLIQSARIKVTSQVNQELALTYWHIGRHIQTRILQTNRAQYGKQTVKLLSQRLTTEFGKGFSNSSLTRMVKFYEQFPDNAIVATVSQQLSWSHFVELIKLESDIQREFYTKMSSHEDWSVRILRERMDGMLFERSAIAKQPEQVIRQELANWAVSKPNQSIYTLKIPICLIFSIYKIISVNKI